MNHAQLKAFHAVANKGGFTKAARHMGLTQPAVSLQVQALEQNYQKELFVRRCGGVMLTPCGERLLSISRRIFELEEEAHLLLTSHKS